MSITGVATVGGLSLSGVAVGSGWPLVQRDDRGQTVYTVQYLLRAHGHDLGVDGIYGPSTEGNVESFQSARGLTVDGIVGPNTWSSLVVTVSRGDEGDAVRAAQNQLGVGVDGIFGPNTESATEDFQSANGLAVDGIVGPNTWEALVSGSGDDSGAGADFTWPITGYITSPYGARPGHYAVDFGNDGIIGTPIYAARDGVVDVRSYEEGGCGYYLKLGHENGYQTMYCHLNSFDVSQGERVSRGQKIGGMGDTGRSTGPHLHFTVERNGTHQSIPGDDGQNVTAGEPIPKDYEGI
ncbi:peptidoglycan-binding protein (plasmid) [Haloferacaceae archaeon DSL9]